ncbi:MAG TPA: type II toxin-antitoxin system VapC family toxin [Candidatus Limnocylindrales bacterium]|nr:type II toxin-antitoxin system VapC family toxin [Candidatus Limnocylindrales bacterium]
MRAILDTHVFLWWVLDLPRLSVEARSIIQDGANELLFSTASAYELTIKAHNGRLSLPEPPDSYVPSRLAANAFESLSIELAHALRAGSLPAIHRDPFDRMLVAQAQIEGLPILTADPAISRYDVETIW